MISRLHYITQDLPSLSHSQLTEFACKGGADWVQLRVKNKSYNEWLKIAQETKWVCLKYGSKLIINDNVQIAKEVKADGVHLGKEDMNPKDARKFLGDHFIIGGSTNTIEDIKQMIENGADYAGIGPYRYTSTKEKLNPILGLDGIKNTIEKIHPSGFPVIAIGGIRLEDIELLLQTGIHGVAVSSAINLSIDKINATKSILKKISSWHQSIPPTRPSKI